ncbi:unnamed protein product [Musa textilis]
MARIVVLAAGFMAICALSFSPAGAASLAAAPPPSDCSVIVSALMDCFSYVSNDSTTPCPSRSCCAGVADVVTESPECICQALQEANDLGVAVNMTRALALPAACSVKAPKIHCDASSPSAAPPSPPRPSPGPSPSPRPSPVLSPPPPSPPTTPPSPPPATPSPTPATPPPNSAVTPPPTPASAPMSSDAPRLASVVVAIAGLASAIFYQIHFCANVRVECRSEATGTKTCSIDGTTDHTGTYNILVAADEREHEHEICESMHISSPENGCKTTLQGRERARVFLSHNNGIASNTRYVNSLGFQKDTPLPACTELLKSYEQYEV